MTPYQRRAFALCIFALAFIFFYEARGQRLVSWGTVETPAGTAAQAQFWQYASIGGFILAMGTVLMLTLRRPSQKNDVSRTELIVLALALGILLGTAFVSWVHIRLASRQHGANIQENIRLTTPRAEPA